VESYVQLSIQQGLGLWGGRRKDMRARGCKWGGKREKRWGERYGTIMYVKQKTPANV